MHWAPWQGKAGVRGQNLATGRYLDPTFSPDSWLFVTWPVGLMDKASASGAGDSRFESWAGHMGKAAMLKKAGFACLLGRWHPGRWT